MFCLRNKKNSFQFDTLALIWRPVRFYTVDEFEMFVYKLHVKEFNITNV